MNNGTEFLLTRAVDRAVLCRARAAYFFLVVLILPLGFYLYAFSQPTIEVREYGKTIQQECLNAFPGSSLVPVKRGTPDTILIPHGHQTFGQWRLWTFLVAALAVELFLYLIYRMKYRFYFFWAGFGAAVLLPLWGIFGESKGKIPWNEQLFFLFAVHPWLFGVGTLALGALIQLWCERCFVRMEH
jgi:hypothetical protein